MLFEGTWYIYHKNDEAMKTNTDIDAYAKKFLQAAVTYTQMVINSGKYAFDTEFNALFGSTARTGKEIMLYRSYSDALSVRHCTGSYCNLREGQTRSGNLSSLKAWICNDGECIFEGSLTSKIPLYFLHYPIDIYNLQNVASHRSGIAYCIYKGKGRKISKSFKKAILIDGKSHIEIANIFKKVSLFVSYDLYTAYSTFAVLCGCTSVVIPEDGLSEENWRADPRTRYGISYGFDKIEQAMRTSKLALPQILEEEKKEIKIIENFVNEVHRFFYHNKENK
jgi:hypothetical protein